MGQISNGCFLVFVVPIPEQESMIAITLKFMDGRRAISIQKDKEADYGV